MHVSNIGKRKKGRRQQDRSYSLGSILLGDGLKHLITVGVLKSSTLFMFDAWQSYFILIQAHTFTHRTMQLHRYCPCLLQPPVRPFVGKMKRVGEGNGYLLCLINIVESINETFSLDSGHIVSASNFQPH